MQKYSLTIKLPVKKDEKIQSSAQKTRLYTPARLRSAIFYKALIIILAAVRT
jgi:hypothetical protein